MALVGAAILMNLITWWVTRRTERDTVSLFPPGFDLTEGGGIGRGIVADVEYREFLSWREWRLRRRGRQCWRMWRFI
jgi:hypothetical protein